MNKKSTNKADSEDLKRTSAVPEVKVSKKVVPAKTPVIADMSSDVGGASISGTSAAAAPANDVHEKAIVPGKKSGSVGSSSISRTRAVVAGGDEHEKAVVLPKTSAAASTKSGCVEGSSVFRGSAAVLGVKVPKKEVVPVKTSISAVGGSSKSGLTAANMAAHNKANKAAQKKPQSADAGSKRPSQASGSAKSNTQMSRTSYKPYSGSIRALDEENLEKKRESTDARRKEREASDAKRMEASHTPKKIDRRLSGASVTELGEKRREVEVTYAAKERGRRAKESTEEREKAQEVRDQAEGTLNAIKDSRIFESLDQLNSCTSVKDAAPLQAAVVEAVNGDNTLLAKVQRADLRKLLTVTVTSRGELKTLNTKTAEWKARVLKGAQAALKEAQFKLKSRVDQELINNPEVLKQQFRKAATNSGLACDKPSGSAGAAPSTKASSTPATAGKQRVCSSSSAAAADGYGDDDDQDEEEEDDEEAY